MILRHGAPHVSAPAPRRVRARRVLQWSDQHAPMAIPIRTMGSTARMVVSLLVLSLLTACAGPNVPVLPHLASRTCRPSVAPRAVTTMLTVPANPFGIAATSDGCWSFVSLDGSPPAGQVIAVFSNQSVPPRLTAQVPVAGFPTGLALTRDGRYLLVAVGSGAQVIDVGRAQRAAADAVIGTLTSPSGQGAIEVAVSPDQHFAFVPLEGSDQLAVFDLAMALSSHFHADAFVGSVPLGRAPVGLAVSPDGRWLYVTSEVSANAGTTDGTLTVIDVQRAETDPARAVVSTADAGRGPVRVVVTANGQVAWVTARGENAVLAFSTDRLRTNPAQARVARVTVGAAPVGLVLVDQDRRLLVADSNRFTLPGSMPDLEVIDTQAALAGRPAVRARLPAGGFPRELASLQAAHLVEVTNFASKQLETVNLAAVP